MSTQILEKEARKEDAAELIFEKSRKGRKGVWFDTPENSKQKVSAFIPEKFLRKEEAELPEVSELDAVRHFARLSQRNFSIDTHFYPLGSCTMKYNPKINEKVARLAGYAAIHPLQSEDSLQGVLQVFYELEKALCEICGMDRFSLQPAAGAHGEMTGLMMMKAYHESRKEKRSGVLVPDSSHGTNPASAALLGFQVIPVNSCRRGLVDLEDLRKKVSEKTAALMLTNPNTLGLFEEDVLKMAKMVHEKGGLLYYDGANLNALTGRARPGDMGFDVVHLNLHKTFSTPHGWGGPGAGPVGASQKLADFLPSPLVERKGKQFILNNQRPGSIGKVRSFFGNTAVLIRAYTYILTHGKSGLRDISSHAVLNANYLLHGLMGTYNVPYGNRCLHEFVLSAKTQKEKGGKALDIAKRLLDYGFHAPTIYFPLIVEEAMMVEPTETESKETLDAFTDAMLQIAEEIEENPAKVTESPFTTPISRPDEVLAARKPNLRWKPQ